MHDQLPAGHEPYLVALHVSDARPDRVTIHCYVQAGRSSTEALAAALRCADAPADREARGGADLRPLGIQIWRRTALGWAELAHSPDLAA